MEAVIGALLTMGAIYVLVIRPVLDYAEDKAKKAARPQLPPRDDRPVYTCRNISGPSTQDLIAEQRRELASWVRQN